MNIIVYIFLGTAAIFLTLEWLKARRRVTDMQALAKRKGFNYLGMAAPRSLSLIGTEIGNASSISNLIDGESQGVRIITFDCRMGTGKGSWRRTVIAAETHEDLFGIALFNPAQTTERSGKWLLVYQPKTFSLIPTGLLPVKELEARLEAVRSSVALK